MLAGGVDWAIFKHLSKRKTESKHSHAQMSVTEQNLSPLFKIKKRL